MSRLRVGIMALAVSLSGGLDVAVAEEASQETLATGQAAFEAQCSRCHRTADRVMRRVPQGTPEEQAVYLERVLPGHYAPEAGTRAAIIAFLVGMH